VAGRIDNVEGEVSGGDKGEIRGRTELPSTKSAVGATVLRPKIKLTSEYYRRGYFRPSPQSPGKIRER
jgi:hypothetical protein